ncbi:MAG TPA: hypothetical protein VKE42_06510, partial [Candidatus Cybelea sp.]|nr:hypothetical protein [Candidatus Cybelea sp.]
MTQARDAGLHVRYEITGLILDALPIPRNADAVIVEANVRLPAGSPREKQNFTLQWSANESRIPAELVASDEARKFLRVIFRLSVPEHATRAVIRWCEHSLGEVDVPVVAMNEVIDAFMLEMPTVHASLGGRAIAGRTFVTGQAKNLFASAVVRNSHLLAATRDFGLCVQIHDAHGERLGTADIPFTSDEMRMKQTLATAQLPKLTRIGVYEISWHLASRCLASLRIRVVAKRTFLRSLRVSATRFVLEKTDGTRQCVRALPGCHGKFNLDSVERLAPVF